MQSAARSAARVTRAEIEDFLFREAALLDAWRLEEWLDLLTGDATYRIPPNDAPDADHRDTLFTIADDIDRIRGRVKRLLNVEAHAEYPRSRTRRLISNVRILAVEEPHIRATANFAVYRFRRDQRVGAYVGRYDYRLRIENGAIKIAERAAALDCEELGGLGSVSFLL